MAQRLSDYTNSLTDAGTLDGSEVLYLASNEKTTVGAVRGGLNIKVISIGDWDMDATESINVAHGLNFADIRNWQVSIINDTTSTILDLAIGGVSKVNSVNVALDRTLSGIYDSAGYDATSFNRGFITIWHV